MATYQTSLSIPAPLDVTFAYVSDFTHATWDPRVSAARRLDSGPIRVGSGFVLESPFVIGTIRFPYQIIHLDAPRRLTLEGATWFAHYVDDLTFEPEGAGTRLHYHARFDLKGVLGLGGPLMQLLFRKIGDDATRGIADAVVRNTSRR
jgi:carbon monoxide dehydrogenase subunit G